MLKINLMRLLGRHQDVQGYTLTKADVFFPLSLTGLHSPLNLKAEAVNGSNLLIISWDFQAGAPYSRIHIRTYFSRPGIQGHDTASAGLTNSSLCDGVKCSYCFFNSKIPSASCHNFNPGYSFSVGVDMLDFEMLVSYKVGACSSNESSSCLDSSWKNYTIPPGGMLIQGFSTTFFCLRPLPWSQSGYKM